MLRVFAGVVQLKGRRGLADTTAVWWSEVACCARYGYEVLFLTVNERIDTIPLYCLRYKSVILRRSTCLTRYAGSSDEETL